ncbi:MAG: amidohydrolase family protein [bacterium]
MSPLLEVARRARCVAAVLLAAVPVSLSAQAAQHPLTQTTGQQPIVIRGGWLFTATGDNVVRNQGVLIVGGRFVAVNRPIAAGEAPGARVVDLRDDEYVLPGIFDVHAHYNMTLGENGLRSDEYTYNPLIFLANGVTSTFPAGEYDPDAMMDTRKRIDAGEQIGPRIYNSGPYFGTARRGWNANATQADVYRDVDEWAAKGARAFKAKGIAPQHLRWLIERAHLHGLTVTAHLESGFRNSTNARDAILMGIDRVEHILGGDQLDPNTTAYPSWSMVDTSSKPFKDIVALFISRHVMFDPTITAPVYFSRLQEGFDYWVDERKFFTPDVQAWVKTRPARHAVASWDSLYWAMRRTTKAFYDAGGVLTLGTDNPSTGEFIAGFSAHRELHSLVLTGIPPAAALKIATINGARAMGVSEKLGTIEVGTLADLFVIGGNPLTSITNTRNVHLVVKSGTIYDPKTLLAQARERSAHRQSGPSPNTVQERVVIPAGAKRVSGSTSLLCGVRRAWTEDPDTRSLRSRLRDDIHSHHDCTALALAPGCVDEKPNALRRLQN